MESPILTPVLVLICWSLIIWAFMYAKRIPAMKKAGIDPQSAKHPGALSSLDSLTRAAADNYNHLMEQPTIFYALAFYMALAGIADSFAVMIAWGYVLLRILHSLVQVSANIVVIRFSLFALSTVMLIILAGKSLLAL